MTFNAPSSDLIHVIQGDYAIGESQNVILTAVLGSCVAACLYDPVVKVGGMNHFLLPNASNDSTSPVVYGAQAMEILINTLLKKGARKEHLKAKLFGGAQVINSLSNIGEKNANFALRFLEDEKIECLGQSLGGLQARRVRFWPASGRASQKTIGQSQLASQPAKAITELKRDVELF